MKLNALALDYDGTIATDGWLEPDVRSAIAEVRAGGITVVLVTGRILEQLKAFTGDLRFVDAVVGENGAVLSFSNGSTRILGQSPPPSFFNELRNRGVDFAAGQCVVEMDAAAAPQVLAAIRDLELPLAMIFNRGRLMVLPQSISKGGGLREALSVLGFSAHNAIGIGDAENDHDLLAACEFGVAAGWGSKVLQQAADAVIPGDGPSAVGPYIRQMAKGMRIPRERVSRSRLTLGVKEDGSALSLAIRNRNIVIAGETISGKSWVNGLACEQLILQGYSVCVIDAEGDYRTLETLPGVVVLGGDIRPPDLPDLTRVLRQPQMSVIVDLSHLPYHDKVDYLGELLPMLATLRKTTGLPHRIVLDEAHYFLHGPNVGDLLDLDLGAYTLVTYRLSDLHPNLRAAMDGVILKRTTDPQEIDALADIVGHTKLTPKWRAILSALEVSEAVLLPGIEEAEGKLLKFQLLPRLTRHVRHKTKYVDVQLAEGRGFVFTDDGRRVGPAVRTLKEFVEALQALPLRVLEGHAQRGDFSRWVAGVFHDHVLASALQRVERRHRLGQMQNLYSTLTYSIEERYDLPLLSPHSYSRATAGGARS
jgi:hydroxymethylpyrimidine pyrophosphatase-like HAD family hydrolase